MWNGKSVSVILLPDAERDSIRAAIEGRLPIASAWPRALVGTAVVAAQGSGAADQGVWVRDVSR